MRLEARGARPGRVRRRGAQCAWLPLWRRWRLAWRFLGLARLPAKWVRGRLGLFALAALPFLLILPFTLDGPGWGLGPIRISERGLAVGLAVFARCVAIGCLSLVLVGTVPLHHTLAAAHQVQVPGLARTHCGAGLPVYFLARGRIQRVRVALRTRGFRMTAKRHGYRTMGHVTGAILVRGAGARRPREPRRCAAVASTAHSTPLRLFRTTAADPWRSRHSCSSFSRLEPLGSPGSLVTQHSALSTQHLTHRYADGRAAPMVSRSRIEPGECVALVGPNGAGKTTLFLRLCGVLAGKPGEASVDGLDPADPAHRKKLPAAIGIVFQNPDDQLFSPTVLDDVALRPAESGRAARRGEGGRRSTAAVGLPPEAGERVPFQLSGGDKRRAALAGVLAMRPAVLLLDEPSGSSTRRPPRPDRTRPPASRNETDRHPRPRSGARLCPRVLVLDGGKLVADGPAGELLSHPEIIENHGLEVPYRLRQ